MRFILVFVLVLFINRISAQDDFTKLDLQTYDYYLKGDFRSLEKTGKVMISKGMDYYYLRMRLGITSFNKERYSKAFKHFTKALQFNLLDTISQGYIYDTYQLSGRRNDAELYLESIPLDKRNSFLKSIENNGLTEVYVGSTAIGYDQMLYTSNSLYYESTKTSLGVYAGFENSFSSNFKGEFGYTYYGKTGISYSAAKPTGVNLNFKQNQVYAKLTGLSKYGWEFAGFGQAVFYSNGATQSSIGNRRAASQLKKEFIGGIGLSKNGWNIRAGSNFSYSNFGGSIQIRGEGYITYLPFGNLNLYLTTGGMIQSDKNWGSTYQANGMVGFKTFNFLWVEAGMTKGNSFLSAIEQGVLLNNSFQVPAITAYANFIVLLGKHYSVSVTPIFSQTRMYSYDLNNYTRIDKQTLNGYGCSMKLIYKIK